MSSQNDAETIRLLYIHNPWWTTGEVPTSLAPAFRRRDFYKLRETITEKEITGIVGARRVGKTTLMYQLVQSLLEKVNPSNILFLKVDDTYLNVDEAKIRSIFDLYSINILQKPLENLDERVYILLDEIQSLDNWELFLKRWFDLGYNIKFVVSGSSSSQIMSDSQESLVGRFHPQIVCPMKFLETVRYHERATDPERRYDQINWRLRDALRASILNDDPGPLFEAFSKASIELARERDQLLIYLQDYLIKGGYPAIVTSDDLYKNAEMLRDYLSLTIYKDVVKTFRIRDPKSFEAVFGVIASECCHRLNYSSISRELGIKRDTLRDYLFYLKYSFLVSESRFYSRNLRTQMKKEKKIYVNDIGLRNSVLGLIDRSVLHNPQQMGILVENVVADHCKRLKFNIEQGSTSVINYWNDNRGHEVDIIMEIFRKPIPIEVKYREDIKKSELTGLYGFMEKYETPVNLVVTKNILKMDEKILYVPLWIYLFLC